MTKENWERIGIVASIVGAVIAIIVWMRGSRQLGPAGTPGARGAPGIGIPGPAGMPGIATAAAAPAGEGQPGGSAATVAGDTPPGDILNQFFIGSFGAGTPGPYTGITGNITPLYDLNKQFSAPAAVASRNGNCGCSGGCGGAKKPGGCPNTPGSFAYPDGAGACVATTTGRLVETMERCQPGRGIADLQNILGGTQYVAPGADPNIGWSSDYFTLARFGLPTPIRDARDEGWPWVAPESVFGAA